MTLEKARKLYSDREMWEAETYWRIEQAVHGSAGSSGVSPQQESDTEAAFQAMKAKQQKR